TALGTKAAAGRLRAVIAFGCVFLIVVVLANSQPIALGGIHFYQRMLAPAAARVGMRCRFTPSCSHYAEIVIARDGIVRGGWKSLKRVAQCGPWTREGTLDEP